MGLGDATLAVDKDAEALDAYRHAVEADPTNKDALAAVARSCKLSPLADSLQTLRSATLDISDQKMEAALSIWRSAAASCKKDPVLVHILAKVREWRPAFATLVIVGNGYTLPVLGESLGTTPRISSLLIKPASAVCNLDCKYCFYLDREADPYKALPARRMSDETLERLVDSYVFYSYPNSTFAFQGGEPTLAGPAFFEKLVELQKHYGRDGQSVSNSLQTNGILLDERWCEIFRATNWLLGVSIDGPEQMHDTYRFNKGGQGTWKQVMRSIELLQKQRVDFNVLCVLSQANVDKPREVYRFFRSLGVDYLQFIPLAEFDSEGKPYPFTITPEQYGRFLTETFDLWWPDRRRVRIRYFDNIAEAVAGQKPGNCTMHETCDSYAVVEYNGDVYPCDFFVESSWKLGNIHLDSWAEIARKQSRYSFAAKKTLPRPECQVCEYQTVCRGGCPKLRHAQHRRFEDLDYFCQSYKMIYGKALEPLRKEVRQLMGNAARTSGEARQ